MRQKGVKTRSTNKGKLQMRQKSYRVADWKAFSQLYKRLEFATGITRESEPRLYHVLLERDCIRIRRILVDFRHEASVFFWQASLPDAIVGLYKAIKDIGFFLSVVLAVCAVINPNHAWRAQQQAPLDLVEHFRLVAWRSNAGASHSKTPARARPKQGVSSCHKVLHEYTSRIIIVNEPGKVEKRRKIAWRRATSIARKCLVMT
jgi:hypothetical protein